MVPVQGTETAAPIDPQERRLRKISRRVSVVFKDNIKIRDASAAAKGAAEAALSAILGSTESAARGRSLSDISKDDGSAISHELAIERGSARAFYECNESEHLEAQVHEEYGLTSITEDVTTLESKATSEEKKKTKNKNLWKKFKPLRSQRIRTGSGARTLSRKFLGSEDNGSRLKDITRDAWMCGCCGKVFSSYDVADLHEERCIFERIDKLGYRLDIPSNSSNAGTDKMEDVTLHNNTNLQKRSTSFARHVQNISDFDVKPSEKFAIEMSDAHLDQNKEPPPSILRQSAPLHPGTKKELMELQNENLLDWRLSLYPKNTLNKNKSAQFRDRMRFRSNSGTFSDPGTPLSPATMNAVNATLEVKRLKSKPMLRRNKRKTSNTSATNDDLLLTQIMRGRIVMTDQSLLNAVERAALLVLTEVDIDAEKELKYLSNDKAYYDMMVERHQLRNVKAERFRSEGQGVLSKVQNKFVDAYQLMKEGDHNAGPKDQYNRKGRGNEGTQDIVHDDNTLYVNVMVKHSVTVVNNELERMANQRWADTRNMSEEEKSKINNFERFRQLAHGNLVKLAGMALASDFTPRKVAVQLSNELYRLMIPQLKRRGVMIETEIEYRVGPYFILAVNVKKINWQKLIKFTHRDVLRRRQDWKQDQARRLELRAEHSAATGSDDEKTEPGTIEATNVFLQFFDIFLMMWKFTATEMVALFLSSMYYVHWTISLPLCEIFYNFLLRTEMRRYVLSTVTDDIFSYVEEKGMEMEIGVKEARYQASFMLAALREMREDSREAKKKRKEVESSDKGDIIGPLLGPLIKADNSPAPRPPDGFELPENLEFVGLEIDLPVGFHRLRWAFLDKDSVFTKDGIFREAKYENITIGDWNKHNDVIGAPNLPDGIYEKDIIGAEKETTYLMPKSVFVSANMATETIKITAYNEYCFCIKKRCLTPDVPYGSTFVAWTQMVFINTGNNTTHMTCSVEAEFPNGPPMISRQIKSGMRSGVGDCFVLVGETIVKYSDEYP